MSFRQITIQHLKSVRDSAVKICTSSRSFGVLQCFQYKRPSEALFYVPKLAVVLHCYRFPSSYLSLPTTPILLKQPISAQPMTKEMKWSKMTTYLSDRGFPFVFWSFEYKDRLSSLFAILVDCLDAPSPWSFVWLDILWDGLCESVGLKKYYCFCLFIGLFLFCWRCWVRNIPDFATGSIAIADMLD